MNVEPHISETFNSPLAARLPIRVLAGRFNRVASGFSSPDMIEKVVTLRIVEVTQPNGDFCRVGNFTSLKDALEFLAWAKARGWKAHQQVLGSLRATCSPVTYRNYYSN